MSDLSRKEWLERKRRAALREALEATHRGPGPQEAFDPCHRCRGTGRESIHGWASMEGFVAWALIAAWGLVCFLTGWWVG